MRRHPLFYLSLSIAAIFFLWVGVPFGQVARAEAQAHLGAGYLSLAADTENEDPNPEPERGFSPVQRGLSPLVRGVTERSASRDRVPPDFHSKGPSGRSPPVRSS